MKYKGRALGVFLEGIAAIKKEKCMYFSDQGA
jgi:hypothetical protein